MLFNYDLESVLSEMHKILDTEKCLAIDSSKVDDASNILFTCKKVTEETHLILVASPSSI
jgi:hypothetical protein